MLLVPVSHCFFPDWRKVVLQWNAKYRALRATLGLKKRGVNVKRSPGVINHHNKVPFTSANDEEPDSTATTRVRLRRSIRIGIDVSVSRSRSRRATLPFWFHGMRAAAAASLVWTANRPSAVAVISTSPSRSVR